MPGSCNPTPWAEAGQAQGIPSGRGGAGAGYPLGHHLRQGALGCDPHRPYWGVSCCFTCLSPPHLGDLSWPGLASHREGCSQPCMGKGAPGLIWNGEGCSWPRMRRGAPGLARGGVFPTASRSPHPHSGMASAQSPGRPWGFKPQLLRPVQRRSFTPQPSPVCPPVLSLT